MNPATRALLVIAGTASLLSGPSSAEEKPGNAEQLHWMAGCWENTSNDRKSEEQWTAPGGGMLLGMSRTVAGGRAVAYEFLRIEEKQGRLVLTALPSGQSGASFQQTDITDSSITFENPDHDFPQQVGYSLQPDGSLMGRIQGKRDGEVRTVEFPLHRASCPVGSP